MQKLYTQLNFNRWLKALDTNDKNTTTKKKKKDTMTILINNLEKWQTCYNDLKTQKHLTVLFEGSETDPLRSDINAITFATDDTCYLLHLEKNDLLNEAELTLNDIHKNLQTLFNKSIEWITFDCKHFIKLCHNIDLTPPNKFFDVMLASYILRELTGKTDLEACAKFWLSDSELIDPAHQKTDKYHLAHACEIVHQLYHVLNNEFTEKKTAKKLYSKMDLPIAKILAEMEIAGVLIDTSILHKQSQSIAKKLAKLSEKIYQLAGEEFKIESPKQIGYILFEKLELPIIKKTPKGAPSTAEPVLTELALNYEIADLILQYRSLQKLKSTYTDKLPLEVNPKTHRIHTTYLETGTSTGRLASINPNLQNIPVKTEEGRKVRLAFVAPENHKIVAADYSQIELRIMADLSRDPNLLEAFSHDMDVHRHTASKVLDIKPEDVTFEQRRHAKAVNFGLMYGMSAFGLSKQLGIERAEAQKFIDAYFETYIGIREYMDKTYEVAKQQGYVETVFGRRIAVPDINSNNHMRAQAAQRAAINAPLQGSAADIIKQAMINFNQWKDDNQMHTEMIMQVHDELVFQVPDKELTKAKKAIQQAMENAYKSKVPLTVSIGEGNNWQEAH